MASNANTNSYLFFVVHPHQPHQHRFATCPNFGSKSFSEKFRNVKHWFWQMFGKRTPTDYHPNKFILFSNEMFCLPRCVVFYLLKWPLDLAFDYHISILFQELLVRCTNTIYNKQCNSRDKLKCIPYYILIRKVKRLWFNSLTYCSIAANMNCTYSGQQKRINTIQNTIHFIRESYFPNISFKLFRAQCGAHIHLYIIVIYV